MIQSNRRRRIAMQRMDLGVRLEFCISIVKVEHGINRHSLNNALSFEMASSPVAPASPFPLALVARSLAGAAFFLVGLASAEALGLPRGLAADFACDALGALYSSSSVLSSLSCSSWGSSRGSNSSSSVSAPLDRSSSVPSVSLLLSTPERFRFLVG
jgi:hypothetical protein